MEDHSNEDESYLDYKNIRAYHKDLDELRNKRHKTVDDVHKEKQLKRELLDECKRYYDRYEKGKKTLTDDVPNYEAEALLIGFPDLQDHLQEYIRNPSSSTTLPTEEHSSTKEHLETQYVFREIKRTKKNSVWKIIFNGKEFFDLSDMGYEYLHYYVRHSPQEFHNYEVHETVNAKNRMPIDIKHAPIDFAEGEDGKMELTEFRSVDVIESRQDKGDFKTIRNINKRLNDLNGEIEKADREGDWFLKKELEEEKDQCEKILSEYQHKGKLKAFTDSKSKINEKVRKAMDRALEELRTREGGDEIYNHFKRSFKPTYSSRKKKAYKPEKMIPWILE